MDFFGNVSVDNTRVPETKSNAQYAHKTPVRVIDVGQCIYYQGGRVEEVL